MSEVDHSLQEDSHFSANKSRKVLSKVGVVKKDESYVDNIEEEESSPRPTAIENPPEVAQRNKRLFGALMGHLGSAKKILERDSTKIDKQIQAKTLVTEKNQQESHRVRSLHDQIKHSEEEKVNIINYAFFVSMLLSLNNNIRIKLHGN